MRVSGGDERGRLCFWVHFAYENIALLLLSVLYILEEVEENN